MAVRNCPPQAPAIAPARTTAAKPIDFMVFIRFFQFNNPIWPLITRSGQKVHFLWLLCCIPPATLPNESGRYIEVLCGESAGPGRTFNPGSVLTKLCPLCDRLWDVDR